jgi:dolichyl-phosphate-mannose-protein mannosyltransferase
MTKKYLPAPYKAASAHSAPALRLGLIILVLSLATHFAFFSYPAETVFDEVHFGKFISGYFTGEYFFDIHPPLGKLIIVGMAKISGFQPGFSFQNIGQEYPDNSYIWLRFLPKLAGSFLPILIFLIALELGINQKFAFFAGLLVVFENSLLVQSRLILLDAFLLVFGFWGILSYLKFRSSSSVYYLLSAGFFAALAASVKWTGLGFLAIIGLFYLIDWFKSPGKLKLATNGLVFLIVIPFIIYFSIFAVHFSLLDKPGSGDPFHPPDFRQMNIFEKFKELNTELYQSNARLTTPHPYSSQWFQWPFMNKPIYYWNSTDALVGISEKIYLIGNPLIWWLSTIAVIYSIIFFKKYFMLNTKYLMLLIGYLSNWLPFIFIGRVMFLYHYFTSLIFAILITAYVLNELSQKNKKIAFNTILTGSIILFLFFSPLTYGFQIPNWYYKLMVWLPTWR